MGLLTDRINNKLEKSNLINDHALNSEPVPLKTPTKYRQFFHALFVETTDFQLGLILSRRVQLPYWESMV